MKKVFAVISISALSFVSVSAMAISDSKRESISNNCDSIKNSLINLQHDDSRARVYVGRYYETFLNDYIVPLNMRLVENNITDTDLIALQSDFSKLRQSFVNDYIDYQKGLEELVGTNCKDGADTFYEKLQVTRVKQKNVSNEVVKLRSLLKKQVDLVKKLREEME